MRTREDYERLFGGADAFRRIEEHVKAENDAMPPLTARQRDELGLIFSQRMPPRPEPKPVTPRRRIPAQRPPKTTAAAPFATEAAA